MCWKYFLTWNDFTKWCFFLIFCTCSFNIWWNPQWFHKTQSKLMNAKLNSHLFFMKAAVWTNNGPIIRAIERRVERRRVTAGGEEGGERSGGGGQRHIGWGGKLWNNFRATPIDHVINQGFSLCVAEESLGSNASTSTVASIINTFHTLLDCTICNGHLS